MLRGKLNDESAVVHIYSVAPFPFSQPWSALAPEEERPAFRNLVDIAFRAIALRRYRDAAMERRLTELFTKAIPSRDPQTGRARIQVHAGGQGYFRAWVTPIELERPSSLNARIMGASKHQRTERIAETIADGCRAAIEVMIRASLTGRSSKTIPCRRAVEAHKQGLQATLPREKRGVLDVALPGSEDGGGPGLAEICKHCALNRRDRSEPQTLRIGEWHSIGPVRRPRRSSPARKRTSASRSVARIDAFPGAGAVSCAASATAASSAVPSTHRALILIILPATPVPEGPA